MHSSVDQLGRPVTLIQEPLRIVSLVPSITELICDLGLADRLVGKTKFCVRPSAWPSEVLMIGGTKNPHLDCIRNLHPDLILANKEENRKEDIDALSAHFPVWVSDVRSIEDALKMIAGIGNITGRPKQASDLILEIRASLSPSCRQNRLRALYLIWSDPYMAVGQDTFIHDMMSHAGLDNLSASHSSRYPELSREEIIRLDPDVVLLSSEPYPFREDHRSALAQWLPGAQILLADGEIFSWYGSRMRDAGRYFTLLWQEMDKGNSQPLRNKIEEE